MRMNIYQRLLTFALLLTMSNMGQAQDLHFTNNFITPTFFNPAQQGNFSGTVRAGLLFRDQWDASNTDGPFRTFDIAVDAPLVWGLRKTHWLGAGIIVQQDKVAINRTGGAQAWSRFVPGVSYNIGLDKKFNSVISIGVQYGLGSMNISGQFDSENSLRGISDDPDIMSLQTNNPDGIDANYGGIHAGVVYRSLLNKTSKIELGVAALNIQEPETSFQQGSPFSINRRINVHSKYRALSGKRLILEPAVYASFMGPNSNIQVQFRSEYLLKKGGDLSLILGAGYRIGDAPQFLTGAIYKDWKIALSYDHSTTEVANLSPHTIELGVSKIFTVNKRPKTDPIVYCPRL